MHEITVLGIASGAGEGAELLFEYCHKRISVSVFSSTHPPSRPHFLHKVPVEDRLVNLLTWATATADDEEYDEIVENFLLIILNAGKVILDDIRASCPRTSATGLHSVPYSELLCLRLLTLSGELSVVPIESKDTYTYFDPDSNWALEDDIEIDDDFPRYPPRETSKEEFLLMDKGIVWQVLADDETTPCKAHSYEVNGKSLGEEVKRMQEMRNVGFQRHIPHSQAYVVRESGIYPVGFLSQWASEDISKDMDIPSTAAERSRKWTSRVHRTDDGLPDTGLTWGEVENGNDIVVEDVGSWVLGPGHGWEEELVDEEPATLVAGDELGPNRIVELSDNDE